MYVEIYIEMLDYKLMQMIVTFTSLVNDCDFVSKT